MPILLKVSLKLLRGFGIKMKIKIQIFLIAFLMSTSVAFGFNNKEQFLQANQLYKSGNFKEAMQVYEQIPNKNFQINYNLGNCAYKLGKDGLALLYWRRAENKWGVLGRGELLENISLLQNKLFNKNKKISKNSFVKALKNFKIYSVSLIRSAPVFSFQFAFLVLWFVLFLFLRILYKKKNKAVILALFSFVILLGVGLVVRHSFDLSRCGVVVGSKAILWSGPSNNFQQLGFIPLAKEAVINKKTDDFYKVKFNGQVGWVNEKDIKKIIEKD